MTDHTSVSDMFSMFTPLEIQFIEELIDKRIAAQKGATVEAQSEFHSMPEIRQLILNNIKALAAEFGDRPFELAAFRHVLSKKTTLRPKDCELVGGPGCSQQPRWDQQVGNVMASEWPAGQENPFLGISSRRGRYRFRTSVLASIAFDHD